MSGTINSDSHAKGALSMKAGFQSIILKTAAITQSHKDHQGNPKLVLIHTNTNPVNGSDSARHRFLCVLCALCESNNNLTFPLQGIIIFLILSHLFHNTKDVCYLSLKV
jgi:hypothetical protein